jgi:hypothetical protein
MSEFSLKKLNFFIFILVLFVMIYQNQVNASMVDASKYGFNVTDATAALRTAIAQRSDTVIVPNMGTDWIVMTINCTVPNQTIVFEKGVNVVAKKLAPFGYLFSIQNVANVSLIGYGATFRMQKADYMNPALYGYSQWRHCIGITSATGIKILGLTLKESGGDGVAIMGNSSNVLIKDVIGDGHFRNAISPISFKGVTIENGVFINTDGNDHGPWAAIDFEPNVPGDFQVNGKVNNCYMENNRGGGALLAFDFFNSTSPTVSVDVKNCFISHNREGNSGIVFAGKNPGLTGMVSVENCILQNTGKWGAILFAGKPANSYLAKITGCLWQYCNPGPSIGLMAGGSNVIGGAQFVTCTVNEPEGEIVVGRISYNGSSTTFGVANVTGNITVNSSYGAKSQLGNGTNVTLQLTEKKSNPPKITLVKPDKGTPAKVTNFTAGNTIGISAAAYDPDNGFTDGAGIARVNFALWRSNNDVGSAVASYSDVSAPYAWPITLSAKCPRGIYIIRITAYSNDGSFSEVAVPISIFNTIDGSGPYITGSGIEPGHESVNFLPEQDFIVRTASSGFMVYSPFSTDSRIVISDLSGRQVTLAQTVKAKSWNNIGAQNKLSNTVYFVRIIDSKGNNNMVKRAVIAR